MTALKAPGGGAVAAVPPPPSRLRARQRTVPVSIGAGASRGSPRGDERGDAPHDLRARRLGQRQDGLEHQEAAALDAGLRPRPAST